METWQHSGAAELATVLRSSWPCRQFPTRLESTFRVTEEHAVFQKAPRHLDDSNEDALALTTNSNGNGLPVNRQSEKQE